MKMTSHSPILLSAIKAAEGLTLEKLIIHSPRTIVVGRGVKGELNSGRSLLDVVRKTPTGSSRASGSP